MIVMVRVSYDSVYFKWTFNVGIIMLLFAKKKKQKHFTNQSFNFKLKFINLTITKVSIHILLSQNIPAYCSR